jgi:enoyl-CoA hydratase
VEQVVLYERSASVGVITLNRPKSLNAINIEMRRVLPEVVRRADSDPDVRAVVIKGSGDRAFCTGADIKEFVPADSLVAAREQRRPPIWNDVIAASCKPTVAAIQGFCLGGGVEMALACDVRIASEDAVFALPEVLLAIIPGAGGTQRLARVVGVGHATRLILTGDRIDAVEALRIGLISEIVPRSGLEQAATDWATRLSAGGPLAIAYAKEAIRRGVEMPLADGLQLESDLSNLLTNTKDRLEGAAAFREGRTPVYRGE